MNNLFNLEINKLCEVKNNESITCYAKVENVSLQKAVNNNEYLNFTLLDDTAVINAKKWAVAESEKTLFHTGQVVYVTGYGSEYNGKMQLIIETIRLLNETDSVDVKIFYKSAPIPVSKLKEKIYGYMKEIKNPDLLKITETVFKLEEEKFFLFPAATNNHHAYISGLAYHVSTMLDLAKAMAGIYPNINLDLLYAGIILHDYGKVIELSDHLTPEYTTAGKLIGHINICFEVIRVAANKLNINSDAVVLLQHLILSHHGKLEYGSPKTPLLYEAELLHYIDLIDARINMIHSELEETSDNEFTKRIYSLDGRSFYKYKLEK